MTKRTNSQPYEYKGLRLPTTAEIAALGGLDPFAADYPTTSSREGSAPEGDYYSLDSVVSVGDDDAWAILALRKHGRMPRVAYRPKPDPQATVDVLSFDAQHPTAEAKLLVTPLGRNNRQMGYLRTAPAAEGDNLQVWASLAEYVPQRLREPGAILLSGGEDFEPNTRNEHFVRVVHGETEIKELVGQVASLCVLHATDRAALDEMLQHQIEQVGRTLGEA